MNKKILFCGFIFGMLLLTGCGAKREYDTELLSNYDNAIVLCGNHANNVKPDYSKIEHTITNVALEYGNISIICIDGNPYLAKDVSISEQKKGLSSSKRETIAKSQASQIIDFMNTEDCIAKEEEANCLKSFEIASRVVNSTSYKNKNNVVYVFDSGLSTTGVINFCDIGMDSSRIDELIKILENESMIYDLTGVDIYWYGIGDVAEPQADLSSAQKEFLKSFWSEYLVKTGANVYFMTDITTDVFDMKMPYVSPVLSITPAVEWNASQEKQDFPDVVTFDEEILGFKAGTAELIDKFEAEEILTKTSDYLRENPDKCILVVGCTANWGDLENYCKPLSQNRSDVIKQILVEQGIAEERISTYGLGYENPFYKNDVDENGKLVEELAKANRCIVLLDADSELAQKIISDWR